MSIDNTRLLEALRGFVSRLVTDYDLTRVLDHLAHTVVDVLPVTGAGVAVADEGGHLQFIVATDESVREVEELQDEVREGPCTTAFETGERILIHDIEVDGTPWPTFGPAAKAAGIRTIAGFPMAIEDLRIGSLDLYSTTPVELDQTDIAVAQTFADVATSYLFNVRRQQRSEEVTDQLQHALSHRVIVEQAKGIVAGRRRISVDDALDRLRSHARANNRDLREVARDVVEGILDV